MGAQGEGIGSVQDAPQCHTPPPPPPTRAYFILSMTHGTLGPAPGMKYNPEAPPGLRTSGTPDEVVSGLGENAGPL